MKKVIRLSESGLHKLVKRCVKEALSDKVLSEEVDTGQVTAAWEKEQKPPESPRVKRIRQEIARLRREIDKAEEAGEDIKPIQDQIKMLKKQAGFTNVEESRESEMDADWRSMTQPSYPEMRMMNGEMFWPDENLNIYDTPYHTQQKPGNDAMRALRGSERAKQMRSTVRGMRDAGMDVGNEYDWIMNGDPRRK